jgi:hypothetical protein
MTVLAFFPDTSHNIQSVTRWNALVAEFADKPIQFVWITGEKDRHFCRGSRSIQFRAGFFTIRIEPPAGPMEWRHQWA